MASRTGHVWASGGRAPPAPESANSESGAIVARSALVHDQQRVASPAARARPWVSTGSPVAGRVCRTRPAARCRETRSRTGDLPGQVAGRDAGSGARYTGRSSRTQSVNTGTAAREGVPPAQRRSGAVRPRARGEAGCLSVCRMCGLKWVPGRPRALWLRPAWPPYTTLTSQCHQAGL